MCLNARLTGGTSGEKEMTNEVWGSTHRTSSVAGIVMYRIPISEGNDGG